MSSVLTDIMGLSGRAMVEALITGTDSQETIAGLARGPLRRKREELVAALEGLVGPNQHVLLASHLRNLKFVTQVIDHLSAEVEEQLHPSQDLVERLDTIPGAAPRRGPGEALVERAMIVGSPDTVAATVREYAAVGVEHMMLWFVSASTRASA